MKLSHIPPSLRSIFRFGKGVEALLRVVKSVTSSFRYYIWSNTIELFDDVASTPASFLLLVAFL